MAQLLDLLPAFARTPTLIPVLAVYLPAALLLLHVWRSGHAPPDGRR